ncbi:hypothetical protein F5883DRAFT_235623 [Diaporthe sp. PMI_573]|nr:hypothetical protein F5883DRAFT_235623 [Diaporthaceae sp. PMI_573]
MNSWTVQVRCHHSKLISLLIAVTSGCVTLTQPAGTRFSSTVKCPSVDSFDSFSTKFRALRASALSIVTPRAR